MVLIFLVSKNPEMDASPTSEPRVPVVAIACSSDIVWLVTEFRSTIKVFLLSSLLMLARLPADLPMRNWSAASGVSAFMLGGFVAMFGGSVAISM